MAGLSLGAGHPWPLGATPDATGLNVAVFSAHATAVELCVFDAQGQHEVARHLLPGRTGDVWHGHLPGTGEGCIYGLRAHGLWAPDRGHRFNPHKLLLDPYARELVGRFEWSDLHFGYQRHHPHAMDLRDNAALALKARVPAQGFDWEGDQPPQTPWAQTVLYEMHVRSFTRAHPEVPEPLRGSYAGLGHPAALAHLQRLGITAVSLLPVHQGVSEERLCRMGLRNHWNYNTLAFFAPEAHYASGIHGLMPRDEFRQMVKAMHRAGIEVLIDVVYNHSAEADGHGPSISFRGLDNASYYRLNPQAPAFYENWSGCGNTFNLDHPRVLQMVLDSLRYWVAEMHVDGFRFDLASTLARGPHHFERAGAFFKAVAQDPLLSRVKLIAEPWDLGPDGYRLGQFMPGWAEWNDKARDALRGWWLGGACSRGELARRLCASSDVFDTARRAPSASVNYVVSHDGFTLRDLVSYNLRRNEANGENNRDGHGHNLSWNCGHEGETQDPEVLALRQSLRRALLATTLLAQGTPMLASGDELGHTQDGNNNPYCQDNATTWLDWQAADHALIEFTARVIALRRSRQPLGTRWFTGASTLQGKPDVQWLRQDGRPMEQTDWAEHGARVLAMLVNRPGLGQRPLLLLLNADERPHTMTLPAGHWICLLDTHQPSAAMQVDDTPRVREPFQLAARTLALLEQSNP